MLFTQKYAILKLVHHKTNKNKMSNETLTSPSTEEPYPQFPVYSGEQTIGQHLHTDGRLAEASFDHTATEPGVQFDHEPTAHGANAERVAITTEADELDIATVREQLGPLVESAQWQSLEANIPSETDLLPRDLSEKNMLALYDAVTTLPGFSEALDPEMFVKDGANRQIDLGESGQLELVNHGVGKAVWCWKRDGKNIAVGVEFGDVAGTEETPIQIPEDPHLVPLQERQNVKRGDWDHKYEYSDLRTYARIHADGKHVIRLQEFGEPLPSDGDIATEGSHGLAPNDLLRSTAMDRVRRRIHSAFGVEDWVDIGASDKELRHARHYLGKRGYDGALVIDIPVLAERQPEEPVYVEQAPIVEARRGLRQRVAEAITRLGVVKASMQESASNWTYNKSPMFIKDRIPVYRAIEGQYAGLGNQRGVSEWAIGGIGKNKEAIKHVEHWVANRTYNPDNHEGTAHLKDAEEYVAIKSTLGELTRNGEVRISKLSMHDGNDSKKAILRHEDPSKRIRHTIIRSNKT